MFPSPRLLLLCLAAPLAGCGDRADDTVNATQNAQLSAIVANESAPARTDAPSTAGESEAQAIGAGVRASAVAPPAPPKP